MFNKLYTTITEIKISDIHVPEKIHFEFSIKVITTIYCYLTLIASRFLPIILAMFHERSIFTHPSNQFELKYLKFLCTLKS